MALVGDKEFETHENIMFCLPSRMACRGKGGEGRDSGELEVREKKGRESQKEVREGGEK